MKSYTNAPKLILLGKNMIFFCGWAQPPLPYLHTKGTPW